MIHSLAKIIETLSFSTGKLADEKLLSIVLSASCLTGDLISGRNEFSIRQMVEDGDIYIISNHEHSFNPMIRLGNFLKSSKHYFDSADEAIITSGELSAAKTLLSDY